LLASRKFFEGILQLVPTSCSSIRLLHSIVLGLHPKSFVGFHVFTHMAEELLELAEVRRITQLAHLNLELR
jgi:hypothetical protein